MAVEEQGDDRTRRKAHRSTWQDLLPPDAPMPAELLTREELLARLATWRIEATEADLRYWEYEGILPRPVRRWHEGAVRAVYPPWFVPLVRDLRALQRQGLALSEIAARMPVRIHLAATYEQDIPPAVRREAERLARTLEHEAGIRVDQVTVHTSQVAGDEQRTVHYTVPIPPSEIVAAGDTNAPAGEG